MNTPKFWTKLLRWFCHMDFFEELQGDLEEQYHLILDERGKTAANQYYKKEVLKLIRGSVIKPKLLIPKRLRFGLLRMHLVLSIRSIKRNVVFSLLNIVGFGAAISVCLFITNIILTAYQLDNSFENKENKYRISTIINTKERTEFIGTSPANLFNSLPTLLPEASLISGYKLNLYGTSFRGRSITVEAITATPNFLEMLDYKVIQGSISTVIDDPLHVAVTKDFANKYFFGDNVVGKHFGDFFISALLESPRSMSHLDFEMLNFSNELALVKPIEYKYEHYYDYTRTNYIEVNEQVDLELIEGKLNQFAKSINDTIQSNKSYQLKLENLSILGRSKATERQSNVLTNDGIKAMLTFLLIMALIASINYTNLASAKAMHRLKEIGVRKIVGSKKVQVFSQFILETTILGLLGLGLGLIIYTSFANEIRDSLPFAFNPEISFETILFFVLTSIIISIIAGIIPGLFLSQISPLNLFRGKNASKAFSFQKVRNVLLVVQLTATLFVFLFGNLFWMQYRSYEQEELNVNLENVYYLEFEADSTKSVLTFKNELTKLPEVSAVSFMSSLIPLEHYGLMTAKTENGLDSVFTRFTYADSAFLHTHTPKFSQFNVSIVEDNLASLLVSESLIQTLQIPKNKAIGTLIYAGDELRQIAGVYNQSMGSNYNTGYQENSAIILIPNLIAKLITVRIIPNSNAFEKIEEIFGNVFPEQQLAFRSLEELSANRYGEFRKGIVVISYVFISIILITLMGQMGMAIFQAETRTKEIGIRKVLGASVARINLKLIRGTLTHLTIAVLLATPLAYYVIQKALIDFRDPIEPTPQIITQLILIFVGVITLIVISLTTPKARANPVDSLRNE